MDMYEKMKWRLQLHRRRPGRHGLILALASLASVIVGSPPVVQAQTIHRCLGADGQVALQTMACAAGQRLLSSRDYPPPADDPEAARRLRRIEAEMDRRHARAAVQSRRVARRNVRRDSRAAPVSTAERCRDAHRRRERAFARVGLNRTFALSRRMDAEVAAACN